MYEVIEVSEVGNTQSLLYDVRLLATENRSFCVLRLYL